MISIKYYNTLGEESPTGSKIKIIDTKESGNVYEYTCISMEIDFSTKIVIKGQITLTPVDSTIITSQYFELVVSNDTYRKLVDYSIHRKEDVLNEDGSIKVGFVGEFDLFVQMFGHNIYNKVNAIYPFIVDAIQRKYSLN